jgi:ribosomal protein S18 acetylase RimI-like enzyme
MASQRIESGPGEVRISRADLGRRVSVRRISDIVDGRPEFRDVVGVLTSWDESGALTVVNRAGEAVALDERALVAGKPVPPAPVRRGAAAPELPGPAAMQRIAAAAWPAIEQEPLGDWVLRASAGFTRRANSVQTLGDPGLPLDEALARVRAWYAERGLPAYLEITEPGSPGGLAAHAGSLAATHVRTAPLAALAAAPLAVDVRLARTPDAAWLSRYRRVTGGPEVQRAAMSLLLGGASTWFASAHLTEVTDGPAAIGRLVVDGPWAYFGAVEVVPAARRRGLAAAVMTALASRAAEEGATGAYLQVEADNAPAGALYDKLGFGTAYTYHYARL